MNARRLPRVPMFLLTRFAVGPRHESLVGDLIEQFHGGRSRAWFWWQALSAVAASLVRDLAEHRWLAARAVIMGWAAMFATAIVANKLTIATRGRLIEYLSADGDYWPDALFWSSQIPSITFSYLACATCGWLIARAHRRAPAAFILFAVTVFLLEYGVASWMLVNAPARLDAPRGEWVLLVALIGRPVALLLGGLMPFDATPDLTQLKRVADR